MTDLTYTYMYAAESMCMAMIDGLYREKKSCIEFTFRLDHTCYDKEGEDIGRNIYWKIRYTITKGSRYIKVEWTPYSYQEDIEKWVELADHDSCWRECWDEPLSYACKELIEKYDAKGNESWFFRCERVKSL